MGGHAVAVGGPGANYAAINLSLQHWLDLGPVDLGLYLTLVQVVVVVVLLWLAWRQGAGGRRYAMLVCAGDLVPRFTAWFGSTWIGPDPGFVVLALVGATIALQLASIAAVAVAFGQFGELAAERQRRVVVWLLALPLAAAVLRSLLLFIQFGGEDRGSSFLFVPWPLSPFAAYALAAGVLLGLTWLFTTRWRVRRPSVQTGRPARRGRGPGAGRGPGRMSGPWPTTRPITSRPPRATPSRSDTTAGSMRTTSMRRSPTRGCWGGRA